MDTKLVPKQEQPKKILIVLLLMLSLLLRCIFIWYCSVYIPYAVFVL